MCLSHLRASALVAQIAVVVSLAALICLPTLSQAPQLLGLKSVMQKKLIVSKLHTGKAPNGGEMKATATFPQVSVFSVTGEMIFHGSALDSLKWIEAGAVEPSVQAGVKPRNWQQTALELKLPNDAKAMNFVAYTFESCPPCITQLADLKTRAASKVKGAVQHHIVSVNPDA